MRRKDKEITDKALIDELINEATICRIAMCDEDSPYIVPMSFGYANDNIYMHCAKEGLKLDLIRKNPKVCFEIDVRTEVVKSETSCEWSMTYHSVIGFGTARIEENPELKREALDAIMKKYSQNKEFSFPDQVVNAVAIIVIDISSMTGKRS